MLLKYLVKSFLIS